MRLLYHLVRPVARYVLSYYFREIRVEGLEYIPSEGPVLLAANHPTAFIEPCILACYQRRPLSFLARGDLYKNKLATFVLNGLGILPVFRIQDGGFGKLRNNYDTFAACHAELSAGGAVMILAEGRCIHEKALRPLRKGTARIALGALAADVTLKDVPIVPVGVNFDRADEARSEVSVRCGPPISSAAYLEAYRRLPGPTLAKLTAELRQRLDPLVIQFPDREGAAAGEVLLGLTSKDPRIDENDRVRIAKDLPAKAEADRLAGLLHRVGLEPRQIPKRGERVHDQRSLFYLASVGLLHFIVLPQWIMWAVAEFIAQRTVNTIEFYSPVRFAAVAVQTLIVVPLALLFLPLPFKIWVLVALLLTPLALRRLDGARAWLVTRRWVRLEIKDRSMIIELRDAILDTIVGRERDSNGD